jgi:hypothetical protein
LRLSLSRIRQLGLLGLDLRQLVLEFVLPTALLRQIVAQRLDVALQLQHAAAQGRVFINQAILGDHRLVETLTQFQNVPPGIIVAKKLCLRNRRPKQANQRQCDGPN